MVEKVIGNLSVKFIVAFFLEKSVISRTQSISGAVRPSRDIKRLNSKFLIFLSISTGIDGQ